MFINNLKEFIFNPELHVQFKNIQPVGGGMGVKWHKDYITIKGLNSM